MTGVPVIDINDEHAYDDLSRLSAPCVIRSERYTVQKLLMRIHRYGRLHHVQGVTALLGVGVLPAGEGWDQIRGSAYKVCLLEDVETAITHLHLNELCDSVRGDHIEHLCNLFQHQAFAKLEKLRIDVMAVPDSYNLSQTVTALFRCRPSLARLSLWYDGNNAPVLDEHIPTLPQWTEFKCGCFVTPHSLAHFLASQPQLTSLTLEAEDGLCLCKPHTFSDHACLKRLMLDNVVLTTGGLRALLRGLPALRRLGLLSTTLADDDPTSSVDIDHDMMCSNLEIAEVDDANVMVVLLGLATNIRKICLFDGKFDDNLRKVAAAYAAKTQRDMVVRRAPYLKIHFIARGGGDGDEVSRANDLDDPSDDEWL